MLTLDPALFPKLNTRKALVVIDAQNDFLSSEGALTVTLPNNLTERISDLVKAFRPHGDVIWVRSVYEDNRDPEDESILTSDAPMIGGRRAVARGRRPQANPHDQPSSNCSEAFLTTGGQERPVCVRPGTTGAELPEALKVISEKKDMSFIKSHYSAFKSDEILQRLRMKFVTEIFLCGALTNIGIQASAMDAACHGLDITVVEDCCGRRNSMRHNNALKHIVKTTGCEVVSAKEVVEKLKPKEAPAKKESGATTPRLPRTPAPASVLSSFANMSIDDILPAEHGKSHSPPKESSSVTPSRSSLRAKAETKPPPEAISPEGMPGATPEKRGSFHPKATRSRDSEKTLEDAMQSLTMGNAEASNGTGSSETQSKATENPETVAPPIKDGLDRAKKGSATALHADTDTQFSPCAMKDCTIQGNPDKEEVTEARAEQNVKSSVSDPYCEGDTRIHYHVLPDDLVAGIFDELRDEVQWLRMSHQGGEVPRLVAVQGEVGKEGDIPIYRHPADESPPLLPWTSTVKQIKDVVEEKVGHPLNHALIQFYRDGNDYISEHSDKTLDIAKGSYIVNVSLGAERTMIFRTKRPLKVKEESAATATMESAPSLEPSTTNGGAKRASQRAQLPHNSMCQMGLQTNMRWLHAIRQDKRQEREKTSEELAFGGARISLTFRKIGTFLVDDRENSEHVRIWGQGATAKAREQARPVTNGATPEAVGMLQAFGRENQSSYFDWQAHYGAGFDVLNLSASPRLFTSSDIAANMRVQIMLAEYGIGYAKGSLAPVPTAKDDAVAGVVGEKGDEEEEDQPIKLADNDEAKSVVQGDLAIMLYVTQRSKYNNLGPSVFTRFQQAIDLLSKKRRIGSSGTTAAALRKHLGVWETYATESEFIAGPSMTLADFAIWPVLHEIKQAVIRDEGNVDPLAGFTELEAYYCRIMKRESVQKALGGALVPRVAQQKSPQKGE
ncbi:isochorismatase [Apiospora kogelbergensis]|uniref:Isochorismatase n=1 Tax=Apiospora kogelbergensis TaxID=1337665 RepID=A0AAW0R063_9PEZI